MIHIQIVVLYVLLSSACGRRTVYETVVGGKNSDPGDNLNKVQRSKGSKCGSNCRSHAACGKCCKCKWDAGELNQY